jgi:hypothetical protein
MASERRLGAGNGQATDGPEADREHAVEDLCVACARARLPTRLTVHPHEIAGVFTGGHRGTLRDGRALEGLATAGPGDERCPQRTPTADRRPQAMPRSVAPALSRPRPEHAPYRRLGSQVDRRFMSRTCAQITRFGGAQPERCHIHTSLDQPAKNLDASHRVLTHGEANRFQSCTCPEVCTPQLP